MTTLRLSLPVQYAMLVETGYSHGTLYSEQLAPTDKAWQVQIDMAHKGIANVTRLGQRQRGNSCVAHPSRSLTVTTDMLPAVR